MASVQARPAATISLNGEWLLKDFEPGQGAVASVYTSDYAAKAGQEWLPAQVPGDVHSCLLAAGRIPDPFYADNVEQVQWVEQREWWYRQTFTPDLPQPGFNTRDLLTFEGLDTFATVYLNGHQLGHHRNMFRPAIIDVTGRLNYGVENYLVVRLDPPSLYLKDKAIEGQWGAYNANERVYARKTQSQFSWDWAPRLVNLGIWQSVRLDRFESARLSYPYFRTLSADVTRACLSLETEVEIWNEKETDLFITINLSQEGRVSATLKAPVINKQVRVEFTLENPTLWWPHGYGDAVLYDLEVGLWQGNPDSSQMCLDTFKDRVGLCTIELDRSSDADEPGCDFFRFVVNSLPIFAKGANWIPADLLNGRVGRTRYNELLSLLVEANGNMLRVWGGGQYEPDDFYRLADELGILVWQDFMFACGLYPDFDTGFVDEVRLEVEYQVRRLRNRPCLALWCGNNENDWVEDIERWAAPGHDFPGKNLYHEILPEIVGKLDPAHPYWPSSPFGGNDHNGDQAGDRHNWCVWHGNVEPRRFGEPPQRDWSPLGVSYRHYGEDQARFISEFGIHALPVMETIRRNVPPEDLNFGSKGLLSRNKDIPKDKGNMLMLAHTGLPDSLGEYIDFSMITQAEGLKYGIEHYRRRKPHCSGTLVWQWNDCWPGLTWSLVDYYNFPKAGYFFVKRAFAPVLASFKEEPASGDVSLWLTNDAPEPVEETLTIIHSTFTGNIQWQEELRVHVPADTSQQVTRLTPRHLGSSDRRQEFLWVSSQSGRIAANRHFFVEIKDLIRENPAVEVQWEPAGSSWLARLSSPGYAYFTHLILPQEGLRYSDNWFDIFPGETREIKIWRPDGQPIDPAGIEVGWR